MQSDDRKVTGAVFYTGKGNLETPEFRLKASAPCAVLLEKIDNTYEITVTDAEMNQELNEIIVSINDKQIAFPMLKGKDCGKPVTKMISL
ncbi:polysaccharide lyase beta-sandwich domain-containing protein [Pseudarcicella hirudinis]|uniref:polysaccharide lyase beta-sandwich domain-containing protein n=1 Tax=Pseudarcicella hirudinis TaxID=1079859 RepID=UPI0035E6AC1A